MTEITGKYEVEESTENAMEMLGTHEEVRVQDESNDRRYFTITPRIVKAYARNSHDLALWETVKDVAGENGECYLNTDQLAILAGVSTGQISNSRKYWLKIGFLKGEIRKDPGYSQGVWHLSVPDLWAKNIEWCEKHPKIEDRLTFRKAHRSLHRVKPSPSEGKPSPSETKKKLIKKIESTDIKDDTKVFQALEKLMGALNSSIPRFVDTWLEKHPLEKILEAIEVAKEKGARSEKYVDKVLIGWEANGYPKTREEQVQAAKTRAPARSAGESPAPSVPQGVSVAQSWLAKKEQELSNG
jgi:DnaD/phage-associated family protein